MKTLAWMLTGAAILEAGMMMALPYLSPRQMFFGVRAGAEFRGSPSGRKVLAQYWGHVFGWLVVALALLLGVGGLPAQVAGWLAMLPIVGALIGFVQAYFRVRPHALASDEVREAELAASDSGMPWWSWLALPPFVGPVVAMLYMRAHWDEIPARIAAHFAINGEPDRWVERTERTVFAPPVVCRSDVAAVAAAGGGGAGRAHDGVCACGAGVGISPELGPERADGGNTGRVPDVGRNLQQPERSEAGRVRVHDQFWECVELRSAGRVHARGDRAGGVYGVGDAGVGGPRHERAGRSARATNARV
jgi:hypothetical protein